jgi:hypothetical protein
LARVVGEEALCFVLRASRFTKQCIARRPLNAPVAIYKEAFCPESKPCTITLVYIEAYVHCGISGWVCCR